MLNNLNSDDTIPGSGMSLFNTLLGAWLAIAPFLLSRLDGVQYRPMVYVNDVVVGLAIAAMGFWAMRSESPRPNWIQVVLGAWLVAAPILLTYTGQFNPGWNDMLVGALVFLSSLLVAAQKTVTPRHRSPGM